MAHQKRNFDATREMWEARANTASLLPSPSPTKKLAKTFQPIPKRANDNNEAGESSAAYNGIAEVKESSYLDTTIRLRSPKYDQLCSGNSRREELIGKKETVEAEKEPDQLSLSENEEEADPPSNSWNALPELTDDESFHDSGEEAVSLVEKDSILPEKDMDSSGISTATMVSPLVSPMMSPVVSPDTSVMEMESLVVIPQLSYIDRDATMSAPSSGCKQSRKASVEVNTVTSGDNIVSRAPVNFNLASNPLAESLHIPALIFDEPAQDVTKKVVEGSSIIGMQKEIKALEAEADYQQSVVTQIRRTVTASGQLANHSMVQPKAQAERSVLIAARKRRGCLAQVGRYKSVLASYQENRCSDFHSLWNPHYSARLTFQSIELRISPEFVADLKNDSGAEFFVVTMFMLCEQVYATEVLHLEEFRQNGSLLITNMIQFQNVQHSFQLEVEAYLIIIGMSGLSKLIVNQSFVASKPRTDPSDHGCETMASKFCTENLGAVLFYNLSYAALRNIPPCKLWRRRITHNDERIITATGDEAKGTSHTPGFLKRLMAALPKSGSKAESSSSGTSAFRSSEQANVMSLGSVVLTLGNYLQKRHVLSDGLVVQQYVVTLNTDISLDLEINVPHSGFLTFHCFMDLGIDWVRRWCVIKGSMLFFWRYPDDVEKNVTPVVRFDLQHCISQTVQKASSQQCARPYTFVLHTDRRVFEKAGQNDEEPNNFEYFIAADGKEAMLGWLEKLNVVMNTLRDWELALPRSTDV